MRASLLTAIAILAMAASAVRAGSTGHETQPVPGGTLTVAAGSDQLLLWPWTGRDFSGTRLDPVNLIFVGDADPRQIRQALLGLDGFRGGFGFPNAAPFDCVWSDAIGAPETAWGEAEGWTGSAVGLQCGAYTGLRFHMRLFRQDRFTIGAAHFELLIPGTADHEVLSWELAEALVAADLARAGALLRPPEPTPPISDAPTWRAIRREVFNLLPLELRLALQLPAENQAQPVPIPNDGRAQLLEVVQTFEPVASNQRTAFDVPFGQIVPRPFCSTGPGDLIRIDGALRFDYRVRTWRSGAYRSRFTATGTLQVTPIDSSTGRPSGPTVPAVVSETHRNAITDRRQQASLDQQQSILADPAQLLLQRLEAGHVDRDVLSLDCGGQP